MKPCAEGKKHSWKWIKDVTLTRQTVQCTSIHRRGVFKCACGAIKQGQARSGL